MASRPPVLGAVERAALADLRARDAAAAVREYESGKVAVLNNMARLRALRLAKESGAATNKKPRPK